MHSQLWILSILISGGIVDAAKTSAIPTWFQCGGKAYRGGNTCVSGSTCVKLNAWYSQCLPNWLLPNGGTSKTSKTSSSTTLSTTTKSSMPVKMTTSTQTTSLAPTTSRTSQTPTVSPTTSKSTVSNVQITGTPILVTTTSTTTTTTTTTTSETKSGSFTRPLMFGYAPASRMGVAARAEETYKASITYYGAGDSFGSPNCNTNTAACGFYTYPGYSAAVSQNLYGVGPGAGAGPACGTCWKLIGETDSSGNLLSNAGTSIVVMVNNLCPADGNPLCSQPDLTSTNQYGANVNFDLCSDSGARAAFFGDDGVGLAIGSAQQVDCSEWNGEVKY